MTAHKAARHRTDWPTWFLLALVLAAFIWHAASSNFLQDDSYITYRYARNVVRGLGPVFNPGERVEGYTNFIWMMLLAGLGILGLPFSIIISLSQILGVVCGAGVIVLFHLLLRRVLSVPPWLAALAGLLLAGNGAFAYWCVSGMETGLFALFLAAAFFFYLREHNQRNLFLASSFFGLSALTRPEGMMFLGTAVLHFVILRLWRDRASALGLPNFKSLVFLVLPCIVLVAPLYAWRLSYYGQLFPNTFYAKTGLSMSYVKAGLQYLLEFYGSYTLLGLTLLLPVIVTARKGRLKPDSPMFVALLVLVVHACYTVAVGGDVLRIFRFFVPILFLLYLLILGGLWHLSQRPIVRAALLAALVPITFIGPFARPVRSGQRQLRTVRSQVVWNRMLENGLVSKMSLTGKWLNSQLGKDDWFACTTIGAVSWFSDRNMIDMLGLTDAVIARHPEHILQSEWHWKERNYNTTRVLEKKPVFIYFSTGVKPSAEAERALFLRPRFRRGYYACPVSIFDTEPASAGQFTDIVYRAKPGNDTIPLEPAASPGSFANRYLDAINLLRTGPDTAAAMFHKCIEQAPPDFAAPWEWLGRIENDRGNTELAIRYFEEGLRRDDWLITAHTNLASILHSRGDAEAAAVHLRKVVEYAPDFSDGYVNLVAILTQLGAYAEAETVLDKAMAKFPAAANLELRLAYLRIVAGRLEEARKLLDSYLARSPGDKDALQLLNYLRQKQAASDK